MQSENSHWIYLLKKCLHKQSTITIEKCEQEISKRKKN